jgi:hypothetical protein
MDYLPFESLEYNIQCLGNGMQAQILNGNNIVTMFQNAIKEYKIFNPQRCKEKSSSTSSVLRVTIRPAFVLCC